MSQKNFKLVLNNGFVENFSCKEQVTSVQKSVDIFNSYVKLGMKINSANLWFVKNFETAPFVRYSLVGKLSFDNGNFNFEYSE